jgi:hypothetical protein
MLHESSRETGERPLQPSSNTQQLAEQNLISRMTKQTWDGLYLSKAA